MSVHASTQRVKGVDAAAQSRRLAPVLSVALLCSLLAGCFPTRFEAEPVIPAPLVARIPIVIGVHITEQFQNRVHEEERDGADYTIGIGKAQHAGFMRLMNAMFERVVPVATNSPGRSVDPEMKARLLSEVDGERPMPLTGSLNELMWQVFPLGDHPDYEPDKESSIAGIAFGKSGSR